MQDNLCHLCGSVRAEGPIKFCNKCQDALVDIVASHQWYQDLNRHIEAGFDGLTIWNAVFKTDIRGKSEVVVIDTTGSPGVQFPIGVKGQAKCVVCGEFSEDMVCDQCMEGMIAARSLKTIAPSLANLQKSDVISLIQFVLDLVTEEVAKTIIKKVIEDVSD